MDQFLAADCNQKSEVLNTANHEQTEQYFHHLESNPRICRQYYEYIKRNHNMALKFEPGDCNMPAVYSNWAVRNRNDQLALEMVDEFDFKRTIKSVGHRAR